MILARFGINVHSMRGRVRNMQTADSKRFDARFSIGINIKPYKKVIKAFEIERLSR